MCLLQELGQPKPRQLVQSFTGLGWGGTKTASLELEKDDVPLP